LRTAAITGAIRPFVDEGNSIAYLLEILSERRTLSSREGSHLRTILTEFSTHNTAGLPRETTESKQKSSRRVAPKVSIEPLKRREREILERIAEGMTNDEVAHDLSLSVGTVNWYLYQIYQKFDVHRRTHAVTRARAYGLL
jgi:LuxR family maltose regulon positive regulatory protein